MINGLVAVLFIIILLLVITVLEQASTIKQLFKHNVKLINTINKRINLPALSVKNIEDINSILSNLNSGIGFLDLSGHLKPDKSKIELLKRILNSYVMKSPIKDIDDERQLVLLSYSLRTIISELTDKDKWNLDSEDDIYRMTDIALKEITELKHNE